MFEGRDGRLGRNDRRDCCVRGGGSSGQTLEPTFVILVQPALSSMGRVRPQAGTPPGPIAMSRMVLSWICYLDWKIRSNASHRGSASAFWLARYSRHPTWSVGTRIL